MCNAGAVISNWARQDWEAFAAAMAGEEKAMVQAALQRFLLGVAYRQEELHAHELAELLEKTELSGDARAELVDDIEFSLGLLAAYDRLVGDDDEDDDGFAELQGNGREPGPGYLVI